MLNAPQPHVRARACRGRRTVPRVAGEPQCGRAVAPLQADLGRQPGLHGRPRRGQQSPGAFGRLWRRRRGVGRQHHAAVAGRGRHRGVPGQKASHRGRHAVVFVIAAYARAFLRLRPSSPPPPPCARPRAPASLSPPDQRGDRPWAASGTAARRLASRKPRHNGTATRPQPPRATAGTAAHRIPTLLIVMT